MKNNMSQHEIKEQLLNEISNSVDCCLDEFNIKSESGCVPSIDEIEDMWGYLLDRNNSSISTFFSHLVSNANETILLQDAKKNFN